MRSRKTTLLAVRRTAFCRADHSIHSPAEAGSHSRSISTLQVSMVMAKVGIDKLNALLRPDKPAVTPATPNIISHRLVMGINSMGNPPTFLGSCPNPLRGPRGPPQHSKKSWTEVCLNVVVSMNHAYVGLGFIRRPPEFFKQGKVREGLWSTYKWPGKHVLTH
jgi:hypothetical protein